MSCTSNQNHHPDMSPVTKKRFLALLIAIIILTAVIYGGNILAKKLWSVTGQSVFEFAKIKRTEGQRQNAIELLLYGIDRTIRDTINREKAYRIMRQSDELLEQGKLKDALSSCYTAAKIYNEEGEITYRCMLIERKIFETSTPFPALPLSL